MPDPFRLRVMMGLTDCLAEITPANGYAHDLSDYQDDDDQLRHRVFRGRTDFSEEEDPLPMLALVESSGEADAVAVPPAEARSRESDYTLLIQGFVKDDPVHPTDPAYRLLAEVKKRLVVEKQRRHGHSLDIFGMGPGRNSPNQITSMRIGAGVVRPADMDVSATAHFWLPVVLRLVESETDPYA